MQRLDVTDLVNENPSLRPLLAEVLNRAYAKARLLAADETGLNEDQFPETCPFTLEQMLGDDYWPE